jgi:photosystem II stability/assembly factor-like uncharacterized protein
VGDSGTVLRSADAGRSFSVVRSGGPALRAIRFAEDAAHGFAAGDSGALLASSDGGATWRSLPQARADLHGLSISEDGKRVIAVGAAGLILRSTDSGASWAEIATGTAKGLNAIGFLYENTDVGWVVGDSGTLLYTDDGGAHFRALQSPLAVDLYSVEDL